MSAALANIRPCLVVQPSGAIRGRAVKVTVRPAGRQSDDAAKVADGRPAVLVRVVGQSAIVVEHGVVRLQIDRTPIVKDGLRQTLAIGPEPPLSLAGQSPVVIEGSRRG